MQPVQRIKTSDHKFIAVILIMALAFICICSHSDYADWLVNEDQAGVRSTASAVGRGKDPGLFLRGQYLWCNNHRHIDVYIYNAVELNIS